jgi:hypothetical protein
VAREQEVSQAQAGRPRASLYQSRQQACGIAALVFIGIALTIAAAVAITSAHQQHSVAHRKVIADAVLTLIAVVVIVLGFRAVRAGVIASPDGVTVRNPFRSIQLTWDEIDRFSVESNGPWTIGCVHLRDGTVIKTWGIQGQIRFLFRNSRWATEPVEQLNTLVREHHSGNLGA